MNKIYISKYDYWRKDTLTNKWIVQLASPNMNGWTAERTIIGGSERDAINRIKEVCGIHSRCQIVRMNYSKDARSAFLFFE